MHPDSRIYPEPIAPDPSDAESLDVWGFRDTAFQVRPDGVVVLTGDRYALCGEEMADLLPWVQKKIHPDVSPFDLNRPHYPPAIPEAREHPLFGAAIRKHLRDDQISSDSELRLRHGHGHTQEEMYAIKYGRLARVPDLVVLPSAEEQVVPLVEAARRYDVCLIPYGGGTNVSDALLRELASRTQGGLEMIHPGERIDAKVVSTFAKARARRVRRVQIETDGIALDELAPSELPDIVEGEPWAVLARYAGGGRTQVKLSGELDGKPFIHVWPCELPARAEAPAVRLFWARERVRDLESREVTGRHAEAMKERIVRVAKEHGIASRYTSFVVVEKRTGARRQHGPADMRVVPRECACGLGCCAWWCAGCRV